jgi:hypothetical protein
MSKGLFAQRSKGIGTRLGISRRRKGLMARAGERVEKVRSGKAKKPSWALVGVATAAVGGAAVWAGRYRLMGAVTKAMAKRKTEAALDKPKEGAEKIGKAAS